MSQEGLAHAIGTSARTISR
ncbi:MAG: hypothetical protein ACFB5Z_04755 [Elainellaceae cyanobacterium]